MVNAAVIVWVCLLIFAPALVWGLSRGFSAMLLAGGGAATLGLACFVAYVAGLLGFGAIGPLRCLAALLTATLVGVVIVLVQRRRNRVSSPGISGLFGLPLGIAIACWALVPPLIAIHRQDLTFGMISIGNNDLPHYALAAQNVAVAGFQNSQHIANMDLGAFARQDYIGALAVINFVAAATGLSIFQATFVTLGVAISVLAVALCALGLAIWPTAPYSVAAAVTFGCLASLTTYTYGQFFLASIFGMISVVTALAGATVLAREPGLPAYVAIVGGGVVGVYAYAPLGLPPLVAMPIWAMIAALLGGLRSRQLLLTVAARAIACVIAALALSAVALPDAVTLLLRQANFPAGWSLTPLDSPAALVWPMGIGTTSSPAVVAGSWLLVVIAVAIWLIIAGRRGLHTPVRLACVLAGGSAVVIAGCIVVYGADRYQTWKMQAFLLPIVAVAALPACGAAVRGAPRVGRATLAALAGMVALGPFLLWTELPPTNGATTTTGAAMHLRNSPELANVASLNLRLGSYFSTMSVGAILDSTTIAFTQNSYYDPHVLPDTCTLTSADLLTPSETDYTDVGGGFVLLNQPSHCATRQ